MKSTRKSKAGSVIRSGTVPYKVAEQELLDAIKAEPKDLKVPISVRLDGDVYLELKRMAEQESEHGRYQTILNQILRHYLFDEAEPKANSRKRGAKRVV